MVSGVELEVSPDFLMFVEMNRFYVTSAGFHMLYQFPHFQTDSSNFLTVILLYLCNY